MRVLVLSNMYPKGNSYFGSFIKEQVEASEKKGIEIIKAVRTSKNRLGYFPFFLHSVYCLLLEGYDLVHAHYGFHSALPALIFKRAPLIVTYHRGDVLEEPNRNLIYCWLQRLTVKRASHIIAVSQEIKDVLVSQLGADENKVSVISCGVDTDVFKPYKDKKELRKELGLPEGKPIILFPGPLSYRKGIDILYQCASLLPDVLFVLIGDTRFSVFGFRFSAIHDNCILVGPKLHFEVPKWLNVADIFFLPSRSEGMPVSLLEALSCGIPAITSSVGGIPEIIKDGENGILIPIPLSLRALPLDNIGRAVRSCLPTENISLIVSKITELLESREKREFMGKKARESIKRFDQQEITDKIKKVYKKTLNK